MIHIGNTKYQMIVCPNILTMDTNYSIIVPGVISGSKDFVTGRRAADC